MGNEYFHIAALFCIILLTIVFFSKKRINSIETKLYGILVVSSLFNAILELLVTVLAHISYNNTTILIIKIVNKIDFIHYILWPSVLFLYIIYITYKDINIYKKVRKISCFTIPILAIINFILPIELINVDANTMGVAGIGTTYIFIIIVIYILLLIIVMLYNIKKIFQKKYIPIFALLFMMVIGIIVRSINPTLLILPAIVVYIDFIMYFTIENPDLKILEEYNRNKELVENNIEDKTNMLFIVSEDVKAPLRKIRKLNDDNMGSNDLTLIKNNSRNIDIISNDLISRIDNVLDVSSIDKSKIKVLNNNYNIYNLFNRVVLLVKERINTKVDFNYSISSIIPERLYGDSDKIKQIIFSILSYAFHNTKEGMVDLDITSIIHYDVCRLIITIRDTSNGMDLFEINNILENNTSDFNEIDKLEIDIKMVKKVIELLDGSFLIKSDEGIGSTYTVILNQLIVPNKEKESISHLSRNISNKEKVLLIDDDYRELERIANELKRNNYMVISTMYGKDAIDRVSNGEEFDYIIIDDEMKKYNAVTTIKELHKLDTKKAKIIVMLNKDKEVIKNNYIEDYEFTDYLLKRIYKDEIKRIKEKF